MSPKIRFRWRLMPLLLLVTFLALLLAVRTNERHNIRRAIHEVELNGGYVLYHWESPVVDDRDFTINLPSGLRPSGLRGSSRPVNIVVTDFSFEIEDRPGANLLDFLTGGHTDIDVHTVVVEADNINEDLVDALSRLKKLQSVRWVYNVQKISEEERLDKVHQLEKVLPGVNVRFAANYNLDDR